MNRGVGVLLVLLVIAAALFTGWAGSRRTQYFDPALYRGGYPCSLDEKSPPGPVEEFAEGWFSGPLRTVGEPSLYLHRPPAGATTVRFTFLPAFSEPIIVRIDDLHGEHPRLTATRVVDQVHVVKGPNHLIRPLSRAEAAPISAFVASSGVLDLPPDSCLSGVDGVVYLIEANGPDGYRFINRWGVDDGPIYDLANRMYRLTGWPNGEQGPDRQLAEQEWRRRYPLGPSPVEPTQGEPPPEPPPHLVFRDPTTLEPL